MTGKVSFKRGDQIAGIPEEFDATVTGLSADAKTWDDGGTTTSLVLTFRIDGATKDNVDYYSVGDRVIPTADGDGLQPADPARSAGGLYEKLDGAKLLAAFDAAGFPAEIGDSLKVFAGHRFHWKTQRLYEDAKRRRSMPVRYLGKGEVTAVTAGNHADPDDVQALVDFLSPALNNGGKRKLDIYAIVQSAPEAIRARLYSALGSPGVLTSAPFTTSADGVVTLDAEIPF